MGQAASTRQRPLAGHRPAGADSEPVPLGRDLALLLGAGSQCAAALGKRVIFLSDITLWLSDTGRNWERIGVNFPAAQDELEQQKAGLFITVPHRAHMISAPPRTP